MEKKYHVHDLIACIENDNPFPTGNEQYKNNLKKYINEFPKEFIYEDDWMETIHSFAVYDNLENDLENFNNKHIDRKMKLSDIPELSNLVKNFFIQHESLIQFSNKFKNWVFNKSNELNNEKIIISESINNPPNNLNDNLNDKLINNVDNLVLICMIPSCFEIFTIRFFLFNTDFQCFQIYFFIYSIKYMIIFR